MDYVAPYTAETRVRCERPNGYDHASPSTLAPRAKGCGYVGRLDTYLSNLTSMHNAWRCPDCGSTANAYNRVYSNYIHCHAKKMVHDTILEVLGEQG